MKMIKRYAGILMMLTLLVGFTSCEDDEDIYDDLMGRTWVGDLWFGSDYNPIESGIRLDNNGLGIDYQVYDYDGRPAGICLFGGGLIMAHCTLIMDVILPYVR